MNPRLPQRDLPSGAYLGKRLERLAKEEAAIEAVRELATRELRTAFQTYIDVRDDPNASNADKLRAADRVVERFWPSRKPDAATAPIAARRRARCSGPNRRRLERHRRALGRNLQLHS
jgi:hypothetical protein